MSREPEFLVAAVRRFLHPGAALPDPQLIDWSDLLRLSEAHTVTPMVYKALRDLPIPDAAAKRLRSTYEVSVASSLAQSGELARVASLLQQQSVPVVAIKGPLLSQYLYGDLGSRTSGDIDLLAKREHIVQVRRILVSNGYRVKTTEHWDSTSACLRSRENEMSFICPSGVSVDVHWRLIPRYFSSPVDAFDAWANLAPVNLAGCCVQTLPPESIFLFLCAHGSKHMFERLGWICDVARFLMITSDLDWRRIMILARQALSRRQILLSVRLAADLLGAPYPDVPNDPKVDQLATTVRARLLKGEIPPASAADATRFALQLLEAPSQRLRLLSGLYITPSEAEYRALQLPPWLHFLYYPYRPVRLFWRHALRPRLPRVKYPARTG